LNLIFKEEEEEIEAQEVDSVVEEEDPSIPWIKLKNPEESFQTPKLPKSLLMTMMMNKQK